MIMTINGLSVEYDVKGSGKYNLLILHGWGANYNTFKPVIDDLSAHFKIWMVNFPGCGESEEPKEVWNVETYAAFVSEFMKVHKIQNPIVFGHSHGGRVATYMAAQKNCKFRKLILIDSAGVKPKRKPNYYAKVYSYKAIKFLSTLPVFKWLLSDFMEEYRQKYGSADYKMATPMMRQILSTVVNEDLTPLMPLIDLPTLLVWGGKDTATPLSDGKLMEKLIPGSGLVVFEHAGHYSYLDNLTGFLAVVKNFLEREMVA
jgi:pimeloyl-ACP methyl ester carboxylesterase